MKKLAIVLTAFLLFSSVTALSQIPLKTLVSIAKAEDALNFNDELKKLLENENVKIRARAALAAGRIGDEQAVPVLAKMIASPGDAEVGAAAAFALGEIESIAAADALLAVLKDEKAHSKVKARAAEAAGKIAAANAKDERSKQLGGAILDFLNFELKNPKMSDRDGVLLGLTAVLRARPEGGDVVTAKFLTHDDARVRADAANTLTRIRAKNANEVLRNMLSSDADAVARANAARALGAAEDKEASKLLLDAATLDKDPRVRVSAIRSLAAIKADSAVDSLLERAEKLLADYKKAKTDVPLGNPEIENEMLVLASGIGTLLKNSGDERAVKFLMEFAEWNEFQSPEISSALSQVAPQVFLNSGARVRTRETLDRSGKTASLSVDWRTLRSAAQGYGALADSTDENIRAAAVKTLRTYLTPVGVYGDKLDFDSVKLVIPDVLSEFAKFKTEDLTKILIENLGSEDIFLRTTVANLLAEQPATKESIDALKNAFAASLVSDKKYDDAQLAILAALVKLDKKESFASLRAALASPNHLLRRRAAALVKEHDLSKDFANIEKMVGIVKPFDAKNTTKIGQTFNSEADYRRAVSRRNGSVRAVVTTAKGKFTIEFLPEDAPLTVDNFIKLAKSGYFNGVSIHRVVANFVVQDGDPLGNGSGGPGWSIRDEINMVPYDRGAVGMALSGPHTGGSQWFVTHSPQPHLDGGYTVFGRVAESDMKIVDAMVRGDIIESIVIVEKSKQKK